MTKFCTGLPKNTRYEPCCEAHDKAYSSLGTVSRKVADRDLRICAASKGSILFAWIMWIAVRIFGRFHWKRKQAEALANYQKNLIKNQLY